MTILSIVFNTKSDAPLTLEWKLHDRPYVNDWVQSTKEFFVEHPDIGPEKFFHDIQIALCSSDDEFRNLWIETKNLIIKHTPYWETPRKPNKGFLDKVLKFILDKIATSSSIISEETLKELRDIARDIPSLLFWIGVVDYRSKGAKCWGYVNSTPQWGSSILLNDDDKQYLTTDIVFGNLYGHNVFKDLSWMDIGLMDGDDDNPSQELKDFITDALTKKRVGPPVSIGPGFEIPLSPDISGSDLIVMDILSKGNNLQELKKLGYEAEDIITNLGKYELGELTSPMTDTFYQFIKNIIGIKTIEFLDDSHNPE